MKKAYQILINFIVLVFCLALFVFLSCKACEIYAFASVIWRVVIGAVLSLFLASLLHELGHVLPALILGLRVESVTVLCFKISFKKLSGKRFSLVWPTNFGESHIVPKNAEKYAEKLVLTTAFGLIFSLLFTFFGVIFAILFTSNLTLFCLFGITFPISLYVFLINSIPFFDTCDGGIIVNYFAQGKKGIVFKNTMKLIAMLETGTLPSELDSSLFLECGEYDSFSVRIIIIRFLAYLKGDEMRAVKELYKIGDVSKIPDDVYPLALKELFFGAIINKDDIFIKRHEGQVVDMLSGEEPGDFRVHATYRIYKGDLDFAKAIIDGGLYTLSNCRQNGITKFEKEILISMKSQLN